MPLEPKSANKDSSPFFSVLILYWNSQRYLHDCLQALQNQDFKDFEIILLDNGSPEPLPDDVLKDFPGLPIRFLRESRNLGFAAGNNLAAGHASGQYLVLLNSDAFPQPNWLTVIHEGAIAHPGCSFASKQIMANEPDRLDGEGDNYHASGLVWRRSYGRELSKSSTSPREVFSACGAAAAYPRSAYEAVNGFDERYFAYVEDIDLGFRLRLIGVPCVYLPKAVVYHVGSGSTKVRSDLAVYHGQRNLVWTFVKDMPSPLIWLLLPCHILANLLQLCVSVLRRQGKIAWRAKRDAVAALGEIMKVRKEIQQKRSSSVWSLIKAMDWKPFSPFTKLAGR